jgi:hypothetical protein
LNNFNDILSDRKPNFYFDNINKNNWTRIKDFGDLEHIINNS